MTSSVRPVRRRVVPPELRMVDGERSREALLEAALEEFSLRGYAGARVRDIAARAEVSKDLVGYHFGGKEGLYLAVQRRWLDEQAASESNHRSLPDSVADWLGQTLVEPRPMRLLAWRGLSAAVDAPPDGSGDEHPLTAGRVETRQAAGDVLPSLDPAVLELLLLAAVAAPIVFPDAVRRLFGTSSTDPRFQQRYREGLVALIERWLVDHEASPASRRQSRPSRSRQKGV